MDPTKNTDNQGVGNAGDDRQALFTPQDEQVTGGVPVQPAVDLSHPYLSNHPTQTFNTDAGDIILNPVGAKPKQNKRPFIIGGVILIVFVVVCLTVFLILNKNNSKAKLRASFNAYANYFLYASDSDSDISGLYQYGDQYWFANLSLTESDIEHHFKAADEKFQSFYAVYQNSGTEIDEETKDVINSYYQYLDLYRCITLRPNVSADVILGAYISKPDQVESQINKYYELFLNSQNETTRQFGLDYRAKLYELLNAYQLYSGSGCINTANSSINAFCLENTDNNQVVRANELYSNFMNFYQNQAQVVSEASIKPFQGIWHISRGLK